MDGKLPLKANLELEGRGSLRVATIVNGPIQTNTYIVVSQDHAVKGRSWPSTPWPCFPLRISMPLSARTGMPITLAA